MLTIGGVAMPTPSVFNIGFQDLSNAERNARGRIIIERIRGGVRKIELAWSYVTPEQALLILNAVSPVMFEVEYPDAQTGDMRTGTFYAGDRTLPVLDYRNGVPRYRDLKFNLIEV